MKNPILTELLDHWERLRAGRIAPLRSEIDPRQIENALQHAFILERPENGEARFRIAGMKLSELMGMEVRAMPANAIIVPEMRSEFSTVLHNLFECPEIVELTLEAPVPNGGKISADMLLLPMKNDEGEISRILGCLVASGVAPFPPHRFLIKSRRVTRIVASDYTHVRAKVSGFSESVPSFAPKVLQTQNNTQNYLKLVKSDT